MTDTLDSTRPTTLIALPEGTTYAWEMTLRRIVREAPPEEASVLAELVGEMYATTDAMSTYDSMRWPYVLRQTARRVPALAADLNCLADDIDETRGRAAVNQITDLVNERSNTTFTTDEVAGLIGAAAHDLLGVEQ